MSIEENPWKKKTPPQSKDIKVIDFKLKLRYCNTCNLHKPPRATHCGICDNCVDRFDHHCQYFIKSLFAFFHHLKKPHKKIRSLVNLEYKFCVIAVIFIEFLFRVGNCIGRRNYRFFLLYVTFVPLTAMYIMAVTIYKMVADANEHYTGSSSDAFVAACRDCPICPIIIVYCLLPISLVGGLAGYHYYLSAIDQTTNERIKDTFVGKENPYDKGCGRNWLYFWCSPRYPRYVRWEQQVEPGLEFERKLLD